MLILESAVLLLGSLLTTTFAAPSARQDASGSIVSPVSGTVINPGDAFDFSYFARADYGITSLNYTVFLMTSPPTSLAPSANFATGHYFGRFAEPNYPGNPNPPNPAPTQLVMPDFALSPGGWGVGATMCNGTFHLVVLEEYVTGNPTVGALMSLAVTEVIYNATSSATSSI
ncbi:hypothetical protein EV368DRAFT_33447 [Lentinula lateritia]|uniref:Uncharacterized protein n=1 Tax=Lentinula aff. lateritia TaxID=2804960 RepID=A0ACC1U7P0_9AGAR|nr:hypothetical protein F5876DRAFT_63698 [Lentinula aff. lateritia]KAJ3855994.1 hypothetical protein EV368DRAFT_33447 [Lentinula lateritia]